MNASPYVPADAADAPAGTAPAGPVDRRDGETPQMVDGGARPARHFIHEIIDEHRRTGRFGGRVHTRFPPEPNGYLHIGHAKSVWLNYGLACDYGGAFNLRFDDTNPVKEEQEYVDSIIADVRWLGARWTGRRDDEPRAGVLFASDYFQQMYDWAVELVRKGKAYVCDLSAEEVSRMRGTLTSSGAESPYRNRSVAENLDLLGRMRAGEFRDGARTLRAKIDMRSPNLNLRDPVLYRILHASHHRTGDAWCIYPMYDWAHGFEDSIEGITHSICTLEFENHRPLYDWFIDAVNEGRAEDGSGPWGRKIHHPQQIEFARLNLTHTLMSKRKLLQLVQEGHVRGWDDPRMPTLAGFRRRGYTPEGIRDFCRDVGVARYDGVIEIARLENAIRDDLNRRAPRVMAVLRPLRVVIENWPAPAADGATSDGPRASAASPAPDGPRVLDTGLESAGTIPIPQTVETRIDAHGHAEWVEAVNNPEDPATGTRMIPFSGALYIERDDFREDPPPKYFRLAPGREVRLRYGYFIRCIGVVKEPRTGEVIELRCTYDPATRGGHAPDGRKVKATLHWVSAAHALDAEVRLYDHLFSTPDPENVTAPAAPPEGFGAPQPTAPADWRSNLNPASLEVVSAKIEPGLAGAPVGATYQFERLGYFCVDPDSEHEEAPAEGGKAAGRRLVFNRTVTLRDAWVKIEKRA
jgi:glutaminyl-tRNA synthetase